MTRYSALLPPNPQRWGTFGQDSRLKSPIFGGFRGLLGFVTVARDFIELTLNKVDESDHRVAQSLGIGQSWRRQVIKERLGQTVV